MRLLIAIILFLFSFSSNIYSQFLIPTCANQRNLIYNHMTGSPARIYFDLTEINSSALDVLSAYFYQESNPAIYYRKGAYFLNNFNGTFGGSNFFFQASLNNNEHLMKGISAVQLHPFPSRKDVIVLRENDIHVWWNQNGQIIGNGTNIPKQVINSNNNTFIEKGVFDQLDKNDDIAVLTSSQIKIFRNTNDGFLTSSPLHTINLPGSPLANSKIKIKQVNNYCEPWLTAYTINDKNDVLYSGFDNNVWKIWIYNNLNNNSTTLSQIITFSDDLLNFDLEDLNNDGYNELICILKPNTSNSKIRVYNSNSGGNYSTYYENDLGFSSNLVSGTFGDFNKDGFKDFVVSNEGGLFKIYLNNNGVINQTPSQTFQHMDPCSEKGEGGDHTMTFYSMHVADIYNKGGLALIISYLMDHTGVGSNAIEYFQTAAPGFDLPPAPPLLIKQEHFESSTGKYRPKIFIHNRGDRDISSYTIEKKNLNINNGNWFVLDPALQSIGPYQNQVFIDFSEELIVGEPGVHPDNLFYRVFSKDNDNNVSVSSNITPYSIHYQVGGGEDNLFSEILNEHLNELKLDNYPNPFNPNTRIKFDLPLNAGNNKVILSVYNSLGQLVSVLENKSLDPGTYEYTFDGSAFSSGIYFYKLITSVGIITKKFLLIK